MLYPDNIPYMTLTKRVISLPKGNPMGRNTCVFLFSNNREESYEMVNNNKTLMRGNYYRYYYYNLRYLGKINSIRYNINYTPKKRDIRNEITKKTGLIFYPQSAPGTTNDNHSIFFDLSEYMKIFFSITDKIIVTRKM